LLKQGQKIAASVYYAFDPDGIRHRAKQNHIPSDNCHACALADFGPQLVEQGILSDGKDLRTYLAEKAYCPSWIVLRDVVGDSVKVAFDEGGEFDLHLLRRIRQRPVLALQTI
jgi:hypothetical protein